MPGRCFWRTDVGPTPATGDCLAIAEAVGLPYDSGLGMPVPDVTSEALRPLRRLALVVGMVALSAVGLAVVAACCWFLVPPIIHDQAFDDSYAVLQGFLYPRQPAKSTAFEACVLAAPLLIVAAYFMARAMVARLGAGGLRRWIAAGLALELVFFAACMVPLFYCPHPPLWIPPTWLLCPLPFPPPVPAWAWIGSMLAGGAVCVWLGLAAPGRATARRVWLLLLVLAVMLIPTEFYAPSEITSEIEYTYHLNAMLDALSQSVNGHHLLVDFPHIYGGYIEVLGPLLRFFPRTLAVPLIALAGPSVVGLFLWLLAARLLVRQPAMLALCGLGLLAVTYLLAFPPTYVYSTPRGLFPALGLLLAAYYFRAPSRGRYAAMTAVAALAPIWSVDTGLVLWLGWTLTLLAGDAAARRWRAAALHLGVQAASLAVAGAAFVLYLRGASGEWPNPHLLFYFQSMVVQSGYFCVALVVPSAWIFLALLYLTGLVVAALGHFHGTVDWRRRMILLLSLTGIGMFSYYMGRAAESNLIAVCPPGILLLGLLAGEAHVRMGRRVLPRVTRWFFAPWVVMVAWWAFLFFVHLPVLLKRDVQVARDAAKPGVTTFEADAARAATWVRPGEGDVYFLSGHSGLYYYLTGTVRPLRMPGNVELMKMSDLNVLLDAVRQRRVPKLVVDRNFFDLQMYRPEVYAWLTGAIARNYRVVDTAPGGKVVLEVPR